MSYTFLDNISSKSPVEEVPLKTRVEKLLRMSSDPAETGENTFLSLHCPFLPSPSSPRFSLGNYFSNAIA